tara:strand:+ start:203 stop:418 length:216 start_codon:yes stop_codon:yes gene_type:complete
MNNYEMTISEILVDEILSDTEDESSELLDYYNRASDHDKEVIDRTFLYICGWTFPRLVSIQEGEEYNDGKL